MAQDYWKRLTQIATTPEPRNKPLKTESVGQMAQRAAGGAGNSSNQMADTSGTGVGLDLESKQTSLPLGFNQDSPSPVPNRMEANPMGPPRVPGQTKREPLGTSRIATTTSENDTLSTYNPDLNGKSIVERAQAFSAQRRSRSPLRRSVSEKTPFQQRKEQKARDKFRRDILSRAGAGPGKDISLRAALGALAQFEGNEIQRRGQDIRALTADLNRQQISETAANRQRIEESLGRSRIGETIQDRQQRKEIAEAKLNQDQSQFEGRQALGQAELEQRARAAEIGLEETKLREAGEEARSLRSGALSILGDFVQTDEVTGQKRFPLRNDDPDLDETADLDEALERYFRLFK